MCTLSLNKDPYVYEMANLCKPRTNIVNYDGYIVKDFWTVKREYYMEAGRKFVKINADFVHCASVCNPI